MHFNILKNKFGIQLFFNQFTIVFQVVQFEMREHKLRIGKNEKS